MQNNTQKAELPNWLELEQPHEQEIEQFGVQHNPAVVVQETINSGNTTLIGDYIVASFPQHDAKWLVQGFGNATVQSLTQSIIDNRVTVDRRYIFLLVGHNQLRTATKSSIFQSYLQLIKQIRAKNSLCKIFISSLLPRFVDNEDIRPLIIRYNRRLLEAVGRIAVQFGRVQFISVQNTFVHHSLPIRKLFDADGFTLSLAGVVTLKGALLQAAGFKRNN